MIPMICILVYADISVELGEPDARSSCVKLPDPLRNDTVPSEIKPCPLRDKILVALCGLSVCTYKTMHMHSWQSSVFVAGNKRPRMSFCRTLVDK
jgi:hypothetical protein